MTQLAYASFFDEVDALARSGREWRELAVGLVALRYVDAALKGHEILPAQVSAIEQTVSALKVAAFTKGHVLEMVRVAGGNMIAGQRQRILQAKWKYARRLEFHGAFRCASDIYESMLSQLPIDAGRRRTICLIRLGYCRKWFTDFDGARQAYRYALATARRSGDVVAVLRAQFNMTDIVAVGGRLRRAQRMLRRLRREARRVRAKAIYARTLHAEANVCYFRDDYEKALRLCYRAVRLTAVTESRNRIWLDLANALLCLGALDMARDIGLRLCRSTQQEMLRWGATFLLLEIATAECDAKAVAEHARWLLETRMSPHQRAFLYDALGRAYHAVERPELSREYLHRSVVIATEHGLRHLPGKVEDPPRSSNADPTIEAFWLRSISTELAATGAIRSE